MQILLIFFALGVFALVALVEQVRRDYVGKRRNARRQCYACATFKSTLVPVRHYKGDEFMYCLNCADDQMRKSKLNGYVLLGICALALAMWLILSCA